jgi:glycosyltransferase involved in cell wall biosynthesis
LLLGQRSQGWDAQLLHIYELEGEAGHYVEMLRQGQVPLHGLGLDSPVIDPALARLSDGPLPHVGRLAERFRQLRPDIVHSWLDYTNVLAGVAALLAGVPLVVLSTRSSNPTHFPAFHCEWFRPWYQLLAGSARIRFINNSCAGARDYASWLAVSPNRVHVVRNGIDHRGFRAPRPEEVTALRQEFAIPASASIVASILRLSEEKQPLLLLEAVCRVMSQRPDVHAVIVGVGPLEAEVCRAIDDSPFARRFHLPGRRRDVATIIAASDLVLLTSRQEGTPNVLLEAQLLGRPVVATRVGGTPEAVLDGQTGILTEANDGKGLARAVLTLLADSRRRRVYGQAGIAFVRDRFGLERMVRETCQVYEAALSEADSDASMGDLSPAASSLEPSPI